MCFLVCPEDPKLSAIKPNRKPSKDVEQKRKYLFIAIYSVFYGAHQNDCQSEPTLNTNNCRPYMSSVSVSVNALNAQFTPPDSIRLDRL